MAALLFALNKTEKELLFIFCYLYCFYFYAQFVKRHSVRRSNILEAHNSCTVLRSEETHKKSYRREASQLSLWQNYEGIFGAKQLSVCDSGICSCRE